MKKLMACVAAALFITFAPESRAENNPTSSTDPKKGAAEVQALMDLVNEINAMDRSTMTRAERKEIRKELRSIKKEVHRRHGGGGTLYISGGFLVLIIVLIIIF
jgi:hypothetical protein